MNLQKHVFSIKRYRVVDFSRTSQFVTLQYIRRIN